MNWYAACSSLSARALLIARTTFGTSAQSTLRKVLARPAVTNVFQRQPRRRSSWAWSMDGFSQTRFTRNSGTGVSEIAEPTSVGATLLAKEVSSIVGERLDVLVSNAGIARAATTEVGSAISDTPVPLFRVNRVWEKPSMLQAQELLRRGCLWNTFVTAGRASTFLKVLCAEVPNFVLAINKAPPDNELESP